MTDEKNADGGEEIDENTIEEDDTEIADGKEVNDEPPNRYNVSSYGWDSDVEGLVKRLGSGPIDLVEVASAA